MKPTFYRLPLAACLVLADSGATAADLMDALRLAQSGDPTLEAAQFALEGMRERVPQARAGLLPAANLTGNSGGTRADTEFTGAIPVDRNMKSWTWSLQLTQPLLRLSNVYAYRASELQLEQAEAVYEQARQDLYLRLAQAYFGVVLAAEGIAVAAAEVRALEEQLQQVMRGHANGTHSVTDVDETRARLSMALARQVAAGTELETRNAELEKITGQPLTALAGLHPSFQAPPPEPNVAQEWIRRAREHHPQVRAHRAALAAAEADVKKNRADYLPTLDLTLSYGRNYTSNSLTTPQDYSTRAASRQVGVQLNLPIAAGGAPSARVREAVANKNRSRAELEAAERQAGTDAQQAFVGVVNGDAQIAALNAATAASFSAVKGNRVGFGLGLRINLDVLNAEQQLYTARRDLSKARYETLLQGLKLKAAAGLLTEDDMQAVNALLTAHPEASLP
jgi:outer membrane protein